MSNYYVLKFIDFNKNASDIVGTTYDAGTEKIKKIFKYGKSIRDKIKPPFTCIIDERNSTIKKNLMDRMQFGSNAGDIWLVSEKAQKVLLSLNLPLEFVPITLKGKKVTIENYFLVNVIGKIKCVDFEKSDIDYNERLNYIRKYKSLVLEENKIPEDTDVFLLGEDITMFVIVSNRVKEAIEQAGLTGFVFLKPEDYKTFA